MTVTKEITQKRYSLRPALEKIPKGKYLEAKREVMQLLGITSREQMRLYLNGKAMPTLEKALRVEQYLKSNFPQIGKVWTEL